MKAPVAELDFAQLLFGLYQSDADQVAELPRRWPRCPRWQLKQRRMELGLDRDLRRRCWTRRHSLERCLKGVAGSLHPRLQEVWLVLTVQHGEACLPGLLRLLAHPHDDVAEAAGWALAQLGRVILPDLRERWSYASAGLRDRICQVLCFLGPAARGVENWLGKHCTDWSRALCYRMRDFGWRPLLEWGESPVWLNEECLDALAELAFSQEKARRLYAIRVLGDWGPGYEKRTRILRALVGDADPDVAARALMCMQTLELDPGEDARLRALIGPSFSLRTWAVRSFAERLNVRDTSELAYQKTLLRLLDSQYRLPMLRILAAQAEPDPGDAGLLSRWLSDGDPRVRHLCLQVCFRLRASSEVVAAGLDDTDDSICLQATDILVKQRGFRFVFSRLGRLAVRQRVAADYLILDGLDQVSAKHLRQLRTVDDDWSQQILKQLDVSRVRWENWKNINAVQRRTALGLIRLHQRLPKELKALLRAGQVNDPELWGLWMDTDRRPQVVFQQYLKVENPDLSLARRLGRAGWDMLVDLLSLAAVAEMRSWMWAQDVARDWVIEIGPALMVRADSEAVSHALAAAVASALLNENCPVEERKLPWAMELATRTGSAVAALRYLQRAVDGLTPGLLEEVLFRALDHPQTGVRMQAISILRNTRSQTASYFRQRPPDPEPRVRLRTLCLLHEQGGLFPEELAELRAMAQQPGLQLEAGMLLARLEWEKE